jgi:hypothetical protein
MDLTIKPNELGNLKQEDDGKWSYYIVTKNGKLVREGFPSTEDAVKDAEKQMIIINKVMLKKKLWERN